MAETLSILSCFNPTWLLTHQKWVFYEGRATIISVRLANMNFLLFICIVTALIIWGNSLVAKQKILFEQYVKSKILLRENLDDVRRREAFLRDARAYYQSKNPGAANEMKNEMIVTNELEVGIWGLDTRKRFYSVPLCLNLLPLFCYSKTIEMIDISCGNYSAMTFQLN